VNRRLKRYWHQLLADRRKLVVLLSLFCVGLLLWGRLLIERPVPRTAVADPEQTASTAGSTDAKAGIDMEPTLPRDRVNPVLIPDYGPTARDVFAFQAGYYQQASDTRVRMDDEADEESDEQAKLAAQRADEQRRKRARLATVRAQAESMNLQTTLIGQTPRALINGRLYSVGEQVNGFEIVAIGSRTVKLRKQDVDVTLEM